MSNHHPGGSIRPLKDADVPSAVSLWNSSCARGEVVYSPVTAEIFDALVNRKETLAFASITGNKLTGFILGAQKTNFLSGQTHENTPGYLTMLLVAPEYRRQGTGTALLDVLLSFFHINGKSTVACSGNNPINLPWRVPGTPGHDHNNAPGVDEDGSGYAFLQNYGFAAKMHEVAMYLNLKDYVPSAETDTVRQRLAAEGVYTGRYDPTLHAALDYDGMCDRVGSEYWRNVIRREVTAWKASLPCADCTLWPDGIKPSGPRTMLIAAHEGKMAGFTGPIALQKSGRGWFTGICTDPLYGKRGIGTVLFDLLMREFVREGAAFTTLFTGDENHAQRIYLRAGLRVVRHFAVMTYPLTDNTQYL